MRLHSARSSDVFAISKDGRSRTSRARRGNSDACRRTTVKGAANVLSLFEGKVIVPSTAGVYAPATGPAREDDSPLQPVNAYATAKLALEELCARRNATVLRIFTGYGPDE